ncbi:MAG TPA: ATP-dependent DNA helicase RecQ [Solirubrobacteraceae bacterium]
MDSFDALHQHFGFDAFRPGQREAVDAAVAGRDVLVVMPTGAGKSLCYQLPALMRRDLSIVVSPLVSLMQDQVQALAARAPGQVALINAQQDLAANRDTLERARLGELRLLYVSPERFSAPAFIEGITGVEIGLFVVDEAHCVSQWGHDFRPDYFRLADAARWLGAKSILASTATATPQVASDIVARLGLREDCVRVATGFDRPNLTFAVAPAKTPAVKGRQLVSALREPGATPAIVYSGTRAQTEQTAARLSEELGCEVLAYHAGLPREARARAQQRFMAGEVDVVVATNAFGMGVDKADVRTVVHESVPASLEAYYQEAGRAGRDGQPARALLLAAGKDKGLHRFFIERAGFDDGDVARVARALGAGPRYDVALADLPGEDDQIRAVIGALARAGVIQPAPAPVDRVRGRLLAPFDGRAAAICRTFASEAEKGRWRQYRAIWDYVDGERCRREAILRHFGDRAAPQTDPGVACCDVCDDVGMPSGALTGAVGEDVDGAIVRVVATAEPSVGRTRVVEILRGGRSKALLKHAYDGLPGYGTFDHLSGDEVLERVDALVAAGRLQSTGGAYPKLKVVAGEQGTLAA